MADLKILVKNYWPLLFLIGIGALLRWFNLTQSMSFFYDQGRDALKALGIMRGKFVLVGPSADTSGLFMGPLWYYLLVPLYFIARGNPAIVLWLISFLDLATIPLFYIIGTRFLNKKTGLIAAFFWATGALPVAYARTLSNPGTTAFWTLLLVYALIRISDGRQFYLILAAVCQAVLFQLNAAGAFLLFPFTTVSLILIRPKKVNRKILLIAVLIFIASFLPQVLFEIRNSFRSLNLIAKIFLSSGTKGDFFRIVWLHGENLKFELAAYTFYGQYLLSLFITIIAAAIFLFRTREKKLYLLWFILPLVTFLFLYTRAESHPHYVLTWVPIAIISLAGLISYLWEKHWILVVPPLALFIYFNAVGLNQEIILKDHIAQPADPNRAGLGDQIRVLDDIYHDAGGGSFGYHTYNIVPYWEDDNWRYLFSWYGKGKYGYEPERRSGNPLYLIYEPDPYLPELKTKWLKDFRSPDKGPVVRVTNVGVYTIEKFDKRQIPVL